MKNKFTKDINFTAILTCCLLIVSMVICGVFKIKLTDVMKSYNYSVITILIVMDLFTKLLISTGIMQILAVKIAVFSKGNLRICLVLFSLLMFFVSAFLNNITAVMVVLPVIFVLMKSLNVDKKYISIFFAAILAISNTGGASSPVGDFPALIIMTSGITTFMDYLIRAFPTFLVTSIAIIALWAMSVDTRKTESNKQSLAIEFVQSRYRNIQINKSVFYPTSIILFLMFVAWCSIPSSIIPPDIIALLGYILASAVAAIKRQKVKQLIDMSSVLLISVFLLLATIVSETGILSTFANYVQSKITDPKVLLLAIMLLTSMIAGVFSAGPAAAAMMPIIINLCETTFVGSTHWVAIAYAASICAGSSLFLWSATAGFILSEKVEKAEIQYNNVSQKWGIRNYLYYGLINYITQISIACVLIMIVV